MPQAKTTTGKSRSTYTESNAAIFKAAFDDCILTNHDKIIVKPTGRSPRAWRTKASDALLFLVNHCDKDGKYARFRTQVRFQILPHTGDLHLAFKANSLVIQTINPENQNETWKDKLIHFLKSVDNKGGSLELEELYLSADEQEYARNLFEEYMSVRKENIMFDVSASAIYGLKPKT